MGVLHLTECLETPLVRDELLGAGEAHLLEPAADAEYDAANDHLIDALACCADESSDGRADGAKHEEPTAACDVRDAATYGHDDGSAEIPSDYLGLVSMLHARYGCNLRDRNPWISRVGSEVGIDVS